MDVAPRVDRLFARAVDEQLTEQRLIREALELLAERLARVEATTAAVDDKIGPWSDPGAATADLAVRVEERLGARLDELEMRLDDMAVTIERRAVESMSAEMAAVSEDLRKAVGELARTLVRDRGRITNTLTEHRNAILAELRLPSDRIDLREDVEAVEDEVPVRPRPRLLRRIPDA
ncbi:MAG: hypothetical protein JWP02_1114 [Acidimicrobiales bacterium]|nr:hypothetical protein [Acidimicrobiales bacterium]